MKLGTSQTVRIIPNPWGKSSHLHIELQRFFPSRVGKVILDWLCVCASGLLALQLCAGINESKFYNLISIIAMHLYYDTEYMVNLVRWIWMAHESSSGLMVCFYSRLILEVFMPPSGQHHNWIAEL